MIRQLTATRTAKQERLALLLAAGWGIKAAANEVKVGERTAHTWREDPEYRALVAALRGRLLDEASAGWRTPPARPSRRSATCSTTPRAAFGCGPPWASSTPC
jgi:hypothetical protein